MPGGGKKDPTKRHCHLIPARGVLKDIGAFTLGADKMTGEPCGTCPSDEDKLDLGIPAVEAMPCSISSVEYDSRSCPENLPQVSLRDLMGDQRGEFMPSSRRVAFDERSARRNPPTSARTATRSEEYVLNCDARVK